MADGKRCCVLVYAANASTEAIFDGTSFGGAQ